MIDKITDLLRRVEEFKPKAEAEVEEFRIKILGKKGELNALMEEFKTVSPEMKRELGQKLNNLKNRAIERVNELKASITNSDSQERNSGYFRTHGIHCRQRTRNRRRLARILGSQLSARTPCTRHAGHLLHPA